MTRTEAKKAISLKRVCVNDIVAKSGSIQLDDDALVSLDGSLVDYQRYFYIMLNKPSGYVCANTDKRSKTVFDLLPQDYKKKDLFVCGRLDKDTTGFVLLTNNGAVAHRLLAPKSDVFKTYRVHSKTPLSPSDIQILKEGIVLKDGYRCKPAFYECERPGVGLFQISEGKFHQIKRMFLALDNEVIGLHRCSIHGLKLDKSLKIGECRYLTEEEIYFLENER